LVFGPSNSFIGIVCAETAQIFFRKLHDLRSHVDGRGFERLAPVLVPVIKLLEFIRFRQCIWLTRAVEAQSIWLRSLK
jgi:hypothetical protein